MLVLVWMERLRFPYLGVSFQLLASGLLILLLPLRTLNASSWGRPLYRILPALLFMAAIFRASSLTFPSAPASSPPDTLLHLGEFLVLGLLVGRMLDPTSDRSSAVWSVAAALTLVIAFGFFDEFHQSFVPGRQPSAKDLLMDAAGGLAGICLYRALGPRRAPPVGQSTR